MAIVTAPPRRPLRLSIYTDADALGGAEQSARTLLTQLGEHVTASVIGIDGNVAEWIAAGRAGTDVHIVPPVAGKLAARQIVDQARVIRKLRPNVFQANLRTTFACRYGIALALVTPEVRVIAIEHLPTPDASAFQRFHKRLASKRLAAHVAVGERAARMTEEIVGLPTGSVRAIHNGVPVASPAPRERLVSGPVVGVLGRIAHQKGLDVLMRALESLGDVSAVIVGDGPERAALEALAAELGVSDRLLITGWQDEPRSYLSSIDVYCLPSRFEGFPLAVVEAMLAGLPIVASDVGSVSEAIRDGETGQLVPPEDPAALAGAIRKLLDDRELAQRLGERAQALAMEQFTAERMARAYESVYDEILGR